MKTKDRILQTALRLFNQRGVNKVTVRNISEALEISPGNFSYHFPDKEQIIIDLYEKMMIEMGNVPEKIGHMPMGIGFYLEMHKHIFLIQHTYRFFFLNLFHILTHHPKLKKQFKEQVSKEKQMARAAIDQYKQFNIFTEVLSGRHVERLIEVGHILNHSWMLDAEIHFSGNMKQKMQHYMQLCCGGIEPFLTEEARRDYHTYFQQLAE